MKIGVFDSGLGGLTVVRSMLALLPTVEIVYIADTLHAPYGEKSTVQIFQYALDITQYFLKSHQIDALVIACNTATSAAISALRERFPALIIVGTEPGIKPAMKVTRSSKVGILATPATLKGGKYQELADSLYGGSDISLFEQACPGLVEQIECGKVDTLQTREMLESWLSPMREAGVDTIVLGCTHYPLAGEMIQKVMGVPVHLIETGDAIAKRLKSQVKLGQNDVETTVAICATGEIDRRMVAAILGTEVSVSYF